MIKNKIGRWTVIAQAKSKGVYKHWLCQCQCGTKKIVSQSDLRRGNSRSCGCLRKELLIKRSSIHGHAARTYHSPEYKSWTSMLCRCRDKQDRDYGGRGVQVCRQWRKFKNFLADMGSKPSRQHTIERIDVNGNYEPGNCRWATRKEQTRNQRNNIRITAFGNNLLLIEWSEFTGIKYQTLYNRIFSQRLTPEQALTI